MIKEEPKPLFWVAGSHEDLKRFPRDVQRSMGFALYQAQVGRKHTDAKPLRGFGGASVLEVVESLEGGTYRAVYTVRFQGAVYVVHAFQKKSKRGIATPKQQIDLVRQRLRQAEAHYTEWMDGENKNV